MNWKQQAVDDYVRSLGRIEPTPEDAEITRDRFARHFRSGGTLSTLARMCGDYIEAKP